MMRDSPFHTSATLIQKVRQSINSREPPARTSQQKVVYVSQKRYEYPVQNTVRQSKNPLFSRPSLQFISNKNQDEPLYSFNTCKEIEASSREYGLDEKMGVNPSKEWKEKFPIFERKSTEINIINHQKEKEKIQTRQKVDCKSKSKSPRNDFKQEKNNIFRYQDFEDQLNEMLRDQRNARELLNLIQKREEPSSLVEEREQQEKKEGVVMFVDLDSDDNEKQINGIDFDALREEELAVSVPQKTNLIMQGVSLFEGFVAKIEPFQKTNQSESRKFLIFDGEMIMRRYNLTG